MRWLRRVRSSGPVEADTGRQEALVQRIRQGFGAGAGVSCREQADALTPLLAGAGDEGLRVAARIVQDVAEQAYADVLAQLAEVNGRTGAAYTLHGRNYRALWRQAGPALRSPMFALPCGFHPYVHLAAALAVLGRDARRCARLPDPDALAARVFELLDVTTAGWEFGGVPVDTDAAELARHLISTASQLRAAMAEPAPLPPAVRELMRRNNTTDVHDPTGTIAVGGINLGAEMRSAFLA